MNKNQKELARINRKFAKAKTGQVVKLNRATDGSMHHRWNVSAVVQDHGSHAFLAPDEAVASARQRGIRNRFTRKNRTANA